MHIVACAYIVQNLDIGLTHRSLSHTHTHNLSHLVWFSGFCVTISLMGSCTSNCWKETFFTLETKLCSLWNFEKSLKIIPYFFLHFWYFLYWLNYWHTSCNIGTSSFMSYTLLISFIWWIRWHVWMSEQVAAIAYMSEEI